MEDLALKLNVTKNELSIFLRDEIEENFTELLNKNRVEYLKELLTLLMFGVLPRLMIKLPIQ